MNVLFTLLGDASFPAWAIALIVVAVLLLIMLIFLPIPTWFIAAVSNAHVSMGRLVGMKMRRIKYVRRVWR